MENMDRLDVIFALQKSLDEDIMKRRDLHYSYEEWMQKDALACIEEIMEVLNEVQYKWWKNKKPQDEKAIQEELVDVLHFFVSMCIRSGMDGTALYEGYIAKNRENFDRQYGRSQKQGYEVTYLPVDGNGIVSLDALKEVLRSDTILVSVMMVNNEIGAIEPVSEIAKIVHSYNPEILFHVDAIQAYGKVPFTPNACGIDLLSVSGHKLQGPKGSGFIYKRDKVRLLPEILGGGQEGDMRSGTENVPAIAGLSEAVKRYFANRNAFRDSMYACKTELLKRVSEMPFAHPNAVFEGDADKLSLEERVRKTAPHIVSVSFDNIRSEVLLHALEDYGICVSSGSACSSNHPAISGTLKAIGVPDRYLDSTIRFSFSPETTVEEIDTACDALNELVPKLGKFTVH